MDRDDRVPSFRIQTSESGNTRSLKAVGELDSGSCDSLLEAFEQAVGGTERVEVSLDLSDVSFIDSSGMRSMIQIQRVADERGIPLSLVPPPHEVTELLRTAGIADRMKLPAGTDPGPLGPDFHDRVDIEFEREPQA